MLFGKKKKAILPFQEKREFEASTRPSPQTESPYNPLSENLAQGNKEEDNKLKNYAICYRDREMAQAKGDPMIQMIQAYSENEAALEASRVMGGKYEILAIRFNGDVEYPNRESSFAFPTARRSEAQNEADLTVGQIMRIRGKEH